MSISFQWTKDISVGNDLIDNQHKKLLAQINKIVESLVFGVDQKKLEDIIAFFDEYINEHFSYEEEYMKKINYPHLEEHKKMHQDFINNYIKFKSEFNKDIDKEKIIFEIENYIGKWWIEHIGKEDKKYQLFLEEKD